MAKKKQTNKQKDLVMVMVLSLLLGAGGGYAVGAVTNSDDGKVVVSESEVTADTMTHSHGDSMFMVSEDEAPTVEVMVTEDTKSGYNVKIMTTNFTFTPENVNGDNVVGEGHAHLYVGDKKIGRLYGPDFHYNGAFEGTETFRVTLNANDHSEYALDGEIIEATKTVVHDSSDPAHSESHSSDEMHSDDDTHSHM